MPSRRGSGATRAARPPWVRPDLPSGVLHCHTRRMGSSTWAGMVAGAVVVAVGLSGCIAPDVEVIGALGVTVDEQARPVIVVEACDGAAQGVHLSFDREGLTPERENEEVASWTASSPVRGSSELSPHAPLAPWQGESVVLQPDRGYVATGGGEGEGEVLSQVAFHGSDLAGMDPDSVYANDPDPDVRILVARAPADFTAEICSRR